MANLSFDDLIPASSGKSLSFDDLIPQAPLSSPPDFTSQYNTPLSPADEFHYQQWSKKNNRVGDTRDYDMRGAWSAGVGQAGNGHFPDTYKKPNHPTFSNESQYSNDQTPGGAWADMGNDKWSFTPSEYNLKTYGQDALQSYFNRAEPDSQLVIPPQHLGEQPPAQDPNQAREAYNQLPWYQQAAQAADDTIRYIANGASFGYADKLAGYMNGDGTEAERAKSAAAMDRAGSAGTAANIVGAVAAPVGIAGQGATLAGRLGTGAMQGIPGLAARSGLMAAEGAGYGGLTAAGNDQNIGAGAGYGLVGGAAGNVVGEGLSAGIGKIAGMFNAKPAIPSIDDLTAAKDAAYARADQAGVAYTPNAVDKINAKVMGGLADIGYDPALMPGASVAVNRLADLQGQNVTLTGLDTVRKIASNGFIPGNKPNNLAVSKVIGAIDDVVGNAGADDVLMGDGQAGAQALNEARSLSSTILKSNRVEDAVNKADLRAASTGSGGNVDNATRQNLRRLLENPRGFTPDEQQALTTAVRGTPTQNALRLAGKLSPSGNGLMAALGVGGAMVNPAVGALSLGGMGAKAIADKTTQANVQKLVDIIRAGGSRAATEATPNTVQRLAQTKREAIARMLMGIGSYNAGTP